MMAKCKAEQRGTGASADERLVSTREEAGEKVVTGEMEQSPGDVGGGPPQQMLDQALSSFHTLWGWG